MGGRGKVSWILGWMTANHPICLGFELRAKTSVEGQTALPLEDQGNREEETETKTQVCGTAANVPQLTEPAMKKAEDLIASMQAGLEAEKKQLRRSIAREERNKQSLAKNRQARLWRLSNVLRQKLQWPIRHQVKWQKDLDTKSILPAKFSRNGLWIPWQSSVSNSSKKFQRNCRTSTERAAQPAAFCTVSCWKKRGYFPCPREAVRSRLCWCACKRQKRHLGAKGFDVVFCKHEPLCFHLSKQFLCPLTKAKGFRGSLW